MMKVLRSYLITLALLINATSKRLRWSPRVCNLMCDSEPPSHVFCPRPEPPRNGRLTTYLDEGIEFASYECIEEFQLTGTCTRVCVDGNWVPKEEPKCLRLGLQQLAKKLTSTKKTATTTTTSTEGVSHPPAPLGDRPLPLNCDWLRAHQASESKPNQWRKSDSKRYYLDGCRDGNLTTVKEYVKKYGTQLVDVGEEGSKYTCLIYAAKTGRMEIAEYLVEEAAANVNMAAWRYDKPIHWASLNGMLDMVKYLVTKGSKINVLDSIIDDDGSCAAGPISETPLDLAILSMERSIADYLRNIGGKCHCYIWKGCEHYRDSKGLGWQQCPITQP